MIGWIGDVERETGFDWSNIARRAGLAPSTLSRFRATPDGTLTRGSITKLSQAFPTPLPPAVRTKLEQFADPGHTSPMGVIGPRPEIPIWGVHPVHSGLFRFNPIPIQMLLRPPRMRATDKPIAFYMPDDTMEPRWHAGELVLFDLQRMARPGDYAVFTMTAPESSNHTEVAVLRRYLGRTEWGVQVRALNGSGGQPEDVELPRLSVLAQHPVLMWSDIVG